jgi:hypothetical protein
MKTLLQKEMYYVREYTPYESVLLVEKNGKNHRAGFELTTLVVRH